MKRNVMILTLAVILLLWVSVALAQGGYDLSWWTVDGGGIPSAKAGATPWAAPSASPMLEYFPAGAIL